MRAHITLHLITTLVELLSFNKLPSFCTLVLQYASSKLLTINEGSVLIQTISHYLVNIELFEYTISQSTKVNVIVNESSFFMFVMLTGHSILYDQESNVLTETNGNSCYLSHINVGTYTRTFLTGQHKMLRLTIHPDFIIQQSERFHELQPLLENYQSGSKPYMSLAHSAIAKRIFKSLKKLNGHGHLSPKEFDKKTHNFLIDCLNNYHKNFVLRFINNTIQKNKAEEIANFIQENFAREIVNNKALLASTFCLSQKTMLRLTKKKFGRSLHQHVIELKMRDSLKQLISTNKSVKEVAELMGYHDPYYFSRTFKHYFGVAPSKIAKFRN